MRTVEQYWADFEKLGFLKEHSEKGVRYRLPEHLGRGGFEFWGNTESCMACVSDVTFSKPFIILELVHEKILEFGQFYEGDVCFYKRRTETTSLAHGLNCLVNYPLFSAYKRMEPNIRLINVGFAYRERFFDTLPYTLPEDFWESAATVLNKDTHTIPPLAMICDQVKNCRLDGEPLKIFIHGKALEAFAILLDYIYTNKKKAGSLRLSSTDRKALAFARSLLETYMMEPPKINGLARKVGLNQQKLMVGFKQLYGLTIYEYVKRIRMEKAVRLLLGSEMTVLEIAKEVGYYGDGHFHQTFRDVYGTTPGALRKTIAHANE